MKLMGDATIFMDYMLKSNTKPDVITFTTFLQGWCNVGDMDMAYKVLKCMIAMGLAPIVRTWTVIV